MKILITFPPSSTHFSSPSLPLHLPCTPFSLSLNLYLSISRALLFLYHSIGFFQSPMHSFSLSPKQFFTIPRELLVLYLSQSPVHFVFYISIYLYQSPVRSFIPQYGSMPLSIPSALLFSSIWFYASTVSIPCKCTPFFAIHYSRPVALSFLNTFMLPNQQCIFFYIPFCIPLSIFSALLINLYLFVAL